MRRQILLAAVSALAIAAVASGQAYDVPINPATSSLSTSVQSTANLSGSFRGNYNQTTNPTGTRTVNLVIFGNPAAAPTNLTKTFTANATGNSASNIQTRPTGRYTLVINPVTLAFRLQAIDVDLLGAASPAPTVPVNATITYQSFSTVAPRYDYPFLVPLNIPLGDATITAMTLRQVGSASGTLTPAAGPGDYTFTLSVPCEVRATLTFEEAPIDSGPISQTLTINGTVHIGNASINSSLSMSLNVSQTNNTPVTGDPDQPFDFPAPPTAPAGSPPAHTLLTLTVNSSSVSTSGNAALPATGPVTTRADIASLGGALGPDRQVTVDDIVAFLNAFFAGDPIADIAGLGGTMGPDGQVTADDVVAFLNAFFGGI